MYKNGRVEIIANDLGNRITPSYVAFTDKERLIGEAAKNQATTNPSRTIYDVKRLIGRQCEPAVSLLGMFGAFHAQASTSSLCTTCCESYGFTWHMAGGEPKA